MHSHCNLCELIDQDAPHTVNAERLGVSEATIRRHRSAKKVGDDDSMVEEEADDHFFGVPREYVTSRGKSIRTPYGWEKITYNPNRTLAAAAFEYDDIERAIENYRYAPDPPKNPSNSAFIVSMADLQVGKALADDTPVLTTDGWKLHGGVRPGDYVYAPNGKQVKVLAVTGSSLHESYRVTFDSGGSIVASKDHLWDGYFTHKRQGSDYSGYEKRYTRITTEQMITEKQGSHSFHIANPDPISRPEVELPIDPYTLGAWLGDGRANAGWIVGLPEDLMAMPLEPWDERDYMPGRRVRFALVRNLRTRLRKTNLIDNKHVPQDYLMASEDQRRALLQGLMDTDGTITEKGHCSFENTNENLVQAVTFLAFSLGLKPRMRKFRQANRNGSTHSATWRVTFPATKRDAVFALPRKAARLRDDYIREESNYRYVQSVEPVGLVSAQCITVEGGLYLAGNGLVPTHNCDEKGGTTELEERVMRSFHRAAERAKELGCQEIVLIDAGDIIENFYNTSSQRETNDRHLTAQIRTARRLFWAGIELLTPLTKRLTVISVPSNHASVRVSPKAPAAGPDNDFGIDLNYDLEERSAGRPEFAHVQFLRPSEFEEAVVYTTLDGTNVGVVHGHQAGAWYKVGEWWKGLSHGRRSGLDRADILVCGHWHQDSEYPSGDDRRVFISPTSDGGSSWYANLKGETNSSGMLTLVVSEKRWSDKKIV